MMYHFRVRVTFCHMCCAVLCCAWLRCAAVEVSGPAEVLPVPQYMLQYMAVQASHSMGGL